LEPMPRIMHGVLGASAFSPSMSRNTPVTTVETESTRQQHQPARRGKAVRKPSRHTHDFEKSVWPLFFSGITPTSQWHGATLCVGPNQAKKFPSLQSFSSHTPLVLSKVCIFSQKCHDTDRQARLYPGARGLPILG
jgi:hypothetical protein